MDKLSVEIRKLLQYSESYENLYRRGLVAVDSPQARLDLQNEIRNEEVLRNELKAKIGRLKGSGYPSEHLVLFGGFMLISIVAVIFGILALPIIPGALAILLGGILGFSGSYYGFSNTNEPKNKSLENSIKEYRSDVERLERSILVKSHLYMSVDRENYSNLSDVKMP